MPPEIAPSYRFRFFRAGGVDQVVLDEGALAHLDALDEKLWLALACPTRGLELEPRTLDLIDTDGDGRIRPPEVLAAVKWSKNVFRDLGDLFHAKVVDELPLSAIDDATDDGKRLRDAARRILVNLGRPGDDVVKLPDVLDSEKVFRETKLNGDGVVPVDATSDAELQAILKDILAVMGPVIDRSGAPGVNKEKADAFFDQVDKQAAWLAEGDAAVPTGLASMGEAYRALAAVRSKVDDYFMRARLAAYGPELGPRLDVAPDEASALASTEVAEGDARVARWPLARVVPGAPLPLSAGLNPAWRAKIDALSRLAVTPLLGSARETLSEGDWARLVARLDGYGAWLAKDPAVAASSLGEGRVRELGKPEARAKVLELIAEDAALEAENSGLEAVEKAIRFRSDLVPFLRNFVNFADFYGKREAVFQSGTLHVDGRSCDLCLPVHDVAKHASLAGLAKAYLVYCDCTRKGEEKRTIVAAVTAGGVDNLLVGRNGVFFDRKGSDWDATITKIIENPISVRQAFLSPYKRFLRVVEEQIARRASAADDKQKKALDDHAATAAAAVDAPPPAAPESKKIDIGTVAAIGVAVGGFATFCSSVFATFLGLGMWMPFGLAALVLAISGPAMVIAWLKLRQRNIGPILDANGWAVNAFARINIPFGGALTQVAALPPGAIRSLDDPFAEKKPSYARMVFLGSVLLLTVLWTLGELDTFLPSHARKASVLGKPPSPHAAPSASH